MLVLPPPAGPLQSSCGPLSVPRLSAHPPQKPRRTYQILEVTLLFLLRLSVARAASAGWPLAVRLRPAVCAAPVGPTPQKAKADLQVSKSHAPFPSFSVCRLLALPPPAVSAGRLFPCCAPAAAVCPWVPASPRKPQVLLPDTSGAVGRQLQDMPVKPT